MVASLNHREMARLAAHAFIRLPVGYPKSGVICWLYAAFLQQFLDAALDVQHPLPLLRRRRRVHNKGLCSRLDQPAVACIPLVFQVLQLDFFQWDHMLFAVSFLVHYD